MSAAFFCENPTKDPVEPAIFLTKFAFPADFSKKSYLVLHDVTLGHIMTAGHDIVQP